ncbi:MAG: ATP synthase F1 subunit delta [Planctomycetota bacterium]
MATEVSQSRGHETVLDVGAEQVARVYAKGFLEAARKAEASGGPPAGQSLEDLEAVVFEILDAHPNFAEATRSAFLSHEERVALIDRVLGGRVTPVTLNTLRVLSSHHRLGLLRQVARQARSLFDLDNGRVHVRVTTAQPMDQGLLDDLANTLRAKLGVEPILEPETDEAMIAGIKVRVRDTVYDGSLQTIFAKAKQSIIEHAIERIEQDPTHFLSDEGFLAKDGDSADGKDSN